jgi:hypothetical protein
VEPKKLKPKQNDELEDERTPPHIPPRWLRGAMLFSATPEFKFGYVSNPKMFEDPLRDDA